MADFIHICVLKKHPHQPLAVASVAVGKTMFRESVYGPEVRFEKEVGLGHWSVWKHDVLVGWINMSRIVDEAFLKNTKPR